MAVNILNIIQQARISSTQKALTVSDYVLENTKTPRTFLEAIRESANKLDAVNCADKFIVNKGIHQVGDFIEENLNMKSILKRVGGLGNYKKTDDSILNFICFTISENYKALVLFIETALKGLLIIQKKVEKMRKRVEEALLKFSRDIRDCLIHVILDAKFGLQKIIRTTTSFSGLIEVMHNCPCILDLLKEKFPKCKNSNSPEEMITCLKAEYAANPEGLIESMNKWTKNYLTDNIALGFNALDQAISNMMTTLLKPLRELVKRYCRELNRKHNVDLLLKDPTIRCLFVYTVEFDKKGNRFFGMSIIDMLNTMKRWSTCVEFSCSSLNDEIKRSVQEYNDALKLEFRHWNNEIVLDLYLASIAASQENDTIKPQNIREIYSKVKGKGVFTSILDFYKDIGKVKIEIPPLEEVVLGEAAAAVVEDSNTQGEGESPLVDGVEPFKDRVEPLIIQIYKNLSQEIQEDKYLRKSVELGEWDFKFKKSEAYIEVKTNLSNKFGRSTSSIKTQIELSTEKNSNSERVLDEESYVSPILPRLPTFQIPEDYVELSIPSKPVSLPSESKADLYRRWFQSVS